MKRTAEASFARFGVCRKNASLCANSVMLCASVVNVFLSNFTTETQRSTEDAQRNTFFRQTPSERLKPDVDNEQVSYYRCQARTRGRLNSSLSHLTHLLRAT